MGFYIQTSGPHNKAQWLIANCEAKAVTLGSEPPKGYVPVVVVNNGPFEAAGIAFNKQELGVFSNPKDTRQRVQLILTRAEILKQCPMVEELLDWPV